MEKSVKILIATTKSWNIDNAKRFKSRHERIADTEFVTNKEGLLKTAREWRPDYIFLPHWSWRIPKEIHEDYKCIGFHMTDLPFGRGGSPLQNLIEMGVQTTKITAFEITEEMDAGGIYMQLPLFIGCGNAEQILRNMSDTIFNTMIPSILIDKKKPEPQKGEVVEFRRRTPEQSNMEKENVGFSFVYDFIRMLDGEGYPPAFIYVNGMKIEFRNARKDYKKVTGTFEICE